MPNEYLDRIKGFGAPRRWGQSQKKIKTDERDGSVAGYEVEHWDDRQDAVVQTKPVVWKPLKGETDA